MRRMSVFMTPQAVRDETKTVTRRAPDTWQTLKPGDQLALIEKGQGLKKGEKQKVLKVVTVLSNRVEPLTAMATTAEVWDAECRAEGFDPTDWDDPTEWMVWWSRGHGYRGLARGLLVDQLGQIPCRRIEWEYEK